MMMMITTMMDYDADAGGGGGEACGVLLMMTSAAPNIVWSIPRVFPSPQMFSLGMLLLVVLQKWMTRCRVQEGSLVTPHGIKHHTRALTLILQTYAHNSTLDTLRGSMWANLYLTLMGAKVHPSAYINTLHVTDHDLLEVGPRAVLDTDCTVMPVGPEEGGLRLGKVRVEGGARMGVTSVVLRDTLLQPKGELADCGFLPPSHGVRFDGVRYGANLTEPNVDEEKHEPRESTVVFSLKI